MRCLFTKFLKGEQTWRHRNFPAELLLRYILCVIKDHYFLLLFLCVFSFESELWISTATKSIITPSFSRLLFQVFTILMTHSRCYYCKHKTLRYFCLLQTATRLLWSTCDRCGWPNGWTTRTNMVSAFSCQIEVLVYFSMTPHACCLHRTESTFVLL